MNRLPTPRKQSPILIPMLIWAAICGDWPPAQPHHGSRWRPLRRHRKWKGWQQQQREKGLR